MELRTARQRALLLSTRVGLKVGLGLRLCAEPEGEEGCVRFLVEPEWNAALLSSLSLSSRSPAFILIIILLQPCFALLSTLQAAFYLCSNWPFNTLCSSCDAPLSLQYRPQDYMAYVYLISAISLAVPFVFHLEQSAHHTGGCVAAR
eukprot:1156815-Pelagomonas_calceolata.AAC.4